MPKILRHIYLLFIVIIGWVFFRANDMGQALDFIQVMFGINSNPMINANFKIYMIDYYYIVLAAIVLSTPILKTTKSLLLKINKDILHNNVAYLLHGVLLTSYMFVVIIMLCSSSYNPFLYFRF
jgi:alginate O-acetyltransferase complex protein AlgI